MDIPDMLSRLNGHGYKGKQLNGYPHEQGEYTFPNKTVYKGDFREGMFDGQGTLFFPNGGKFEARWAAGRLLKGTYFFKDNLEYKRTNWKYATDADRRFWTEIQTGIKLNDVPKLTDNEEPAIPKGAFDVGNGYVDSRGELFRYKTEEKQEESYVGNMGSEVEWVLRKCRVGMDKVVSKYEKMYREANGAETQAATPATKTEATKTEAPAAAEPSKAQQPSVGSKPASPANALMALTTDSEAAGKLKAKETKALTPTVASAGTEGSTVPSTYTPKEETPVDVALFCPATFGLPHKYDADGTCTSCGSNNGAAQSLPAIDTELPELKDEADALVTARACPATLGQPHSLVNNKCTLCEFELTSAVLDFCPATLGLQHNYVDGHCLHCGLTQTLSPSPPTTARTCPSTLGQTHRFDDAGRCTRCPFVNSEAFEDNEEWCPMTFGLPHKFQEGVCLVCRMPQTTGAKEPQTDRSFLPLDSAGEPTPRPTTARFCPATLGLPHQFNESGECSNCHFNPKSATVSVFCPATLGRKHNFVYGTCVDCGAPGQNEQGDTTRRANLPVAAELGAETLPCPATLGSGHRFGKDGVCVLCGFLLASSKS